LQLFHVSTGGRSILTILRLISWTFQFRVIARKLIGCVAILVGGEENGRQKILMSVEHGQRPQIRVL
jgi:hypothetical protein